MRGLFQLALYILIIYLGVRFILKPLLRILLQYAVRKVVDSSMEDFKRQQGQSTQSNRPEGSIVVDYIPKEKPAKPSKNKDEGDYVDYEEIK